MDECKIHVFGLLSVEIKFFDLYHGLAEMSSYENVVGGKLKLKGKALDVAGGVKKKKKKIKRNQEQFSQVVEDEISQGWYLCFRAMSNYILCSFLN